MILDLLELSLVECSAGAFFEELAKLFGSVFVVVESPRRVLGWQVQATVDSVDHFVKNCSVERNFVFVVMRLRLHGLARRLVS